VRSGGFGGLRGRAVQLGALAVLGALVPLVVLATLTLSQSEDAVRHEVAARLRLTTALSSALVAEQVGSIVALVEGAAKRPRLVQALADGDPARFDNAEIDRQLRVFEEYRRGRTTSGLLDLRGILRSVPSSPELAGRDSVAGATSRGLSRRAAPTFPRRSCRPCPGAPSWCRSRHTSVRPARSGSPPGRPLGYSPPVSSSTRCSRSSTTSPRCRTWTCG
jgi:hypothetical protein